MIKAQRKLRRKVPQHYKSYMWQPISYLKWKNWKNLT
jgi:hypothetical protein